MGSQNDGGFSLVEVLIAMFLLAVLSLAVLPLIVGAATSSVVNRDIAAAIPVRLVTNESLGLAGAALAAVSERDA